ncbi:periplasmic protein [Citrobacter koseri]|uniref:Periplasmic protein n=1 Tax=Citrobacter koseri TaxID=545 RepID=A0A2X2VGW2_CITKO|nr:periplasmic protein [Citrobacter koseri]
MTTTRLKISKTLLAVMLDLRCRDRFCICGKPLRWIEAQSSAESAGQKVDSSMNKVGNFMG